MSLELHCVVPERDLEVSLEIATGETVALLGPNGSGKSTVLSVISGLLCPHSGSVTLDGRVLAEVEDGRPRTWVPPHDRQVALLAQEALLFPHLTALDNVAFGPRSHGVDRRRSREVAHRWLAEVGVDEYAARRPSQLSGGQAQRVAVARALATDPRLLLLDEPMAALDVAVSPALRQTLRTVLEGRTAAIVTHDVLDALLLADRVVVLERGRVAEQGKGAEVLARPRSAFGARIAGLNLISGQWRDGAAETTYGRIVGVARDPAPLDGTSVVVVFRPSAAGIFRSDPGGSPRNVVPVQVSDLEPRGDQVRVHAGELSADITPAAAAELDVVPGAEVLFVVKAAEVDIYPT